MKTTKEKLVAPCGINCGICKFHLRSDNSCPGCRFQVKETSRKCKIRNCDKRTGDFCYECSEFPCVRLKNLDKRYRTKYNLSEIENLEMIRDKGLEGFLKADYKKWKCPKCGGVVSCHTNECSKCGKII